MIGDKKKLILQALCSYHYTDVISFISDILEKDEDEHIKKYVYKVLYRSVLSEKMETDLFTDRYRKEIDPDIRLYILNILGEKSPRDFREFLLADYHDFKFDENNIDLILPHIDDTVFLPVLFNISENVNLYTRARIYQTAAGFYSEDLKTRFAEVFQQDNELLQLALIKGFSHERYFELIVSKVFSRNPTLEIACLSKFSSMLSSEDVRFPVKKAILNIISEKMKSDNEIIRIAAIRAVTFFDKKLFQDMLNMWSRLHPFYFPVLKESITSMLIMDRADEGKGMIMQHLNIFKIRHFLNFLFKLNIKELFLFIFQNYRKREDFEDFKMRLMDFLKEHKIFTDQRFIFSFFKDLQEAEINYFRSQLEKIFMREFKPFRFKELDIKIISEYLHIFGLMSIEYSSHFNFINYDYIKIAILRFIEKTEENYSFIIECAKYKSDPVKESAIAALGEYPESTNFLIGLFKTAPEYQKSFIIRAISFGRSKQRRDFLIRLLAQKDLPDPDLVLEIFDGLMGYYSEPEVIAISREYLQNRRISPRIRLKGLKLLILARQNSPEDIAEFITEVNTLKKADFIELCEALKFLEPENAIKTYFGIIDICPDYFGVISKYVHFLKSLEISKLLMSYFTALIQNPEN